MLASLAIRDVVLIDRLDLGFAPGLTVPTGRTLASARSGTASADR